MDTLTAPHTTEPGAQGGRAADSSWTAMAAWGAGLIQLALGAGALTGVGGDSAIRMVGIALIVIGVAAIGWGVAALVAGRIVAPRLVIGGSLAGIFMTVGGMTLEPSLVSVFAVGAASALLVVVALGGALALRPRVGRVRSATREASGRRLVGLVVVAIAVAAIVTPALAATDAGRYAVPHGEHSVMIEPDHQH